MRNQLAQHGVVKGRNRHAAVDGVVKPRVGGWLRKMRHFARMGCVLCIFSAQAHFDGVAGESDLFLRQR